MVVTSQLWWSKLLTSNDHLLWKWMKSSLSFCFHGGVMNWQCIFILLFSCWCYDEYLFNLFLWCKGFFDHISHLFDIVCWLCRSHMGVGWTLILCLDSSLDNGYQSPIQHISIQITQNYAQLISSCFKIIFGGHLHHLDMYASSGLENTRG